MSAYFLAPRWAVTRDGGRVHALDLADGSAARLEGAIGRAFFDDSDAAARRLVGLGALNPKLGALGTALTEGSFKPWNRATLLEGSGYQELFLELTASCNERCGHCYAESAPERTETLDGRVVDEVLEAAKRIGFRTAQLTGGDPLVAPTCLAAATTATRLGFDRVEIYTNGLALKGGLFDGLLDLGVSFAFSVYSHRDDAHDAITQTPGSHGRTLDAIRRCLLAGAPIRVGIVVRDSNVQDLEPTIALLQEIGVAETAIVYDRERRMGRGEYREEPVVLDAAPKGSTHRDSRVHAEFGGRIAVRPDGAVVPCIFSRTIVLGNVHETPLDTILKAPEPLASPKQLDAAQRDALGESLSCLECRVRTHALSNEPLVALRSSRAM